MNARTLVLLVSMLLLFGCNPKPELGSEEIAIAKQQRLLVVRNTLDSLVKLKEKNPTVDLSTILPAVERLQADPHQQLSAKAKQVYETLTK